MVVGIFRIEITAESKAAFALACTVAVVTASPVRNAFATAAIAQIGRAVTVIDTKPACINAAAIETRFVIGIAVTIAIANRHAIAGVAQHPRRTEGIIPAALDALRWAIDLLPWDRAAVGVVWAVSVPFAWLRWQASINTGSALLWVVLAVVAAVITNLCAVAFLPPLAVGIRQAIAALARRQAAATGALLIGGTPDWFAASDVIAFLEALATGAPPFSFATLAWVDLFAVTRGAVLFDLLL